MAEQTNTKANSQTSTQTNAQTDPENSPQLGPFIGLRHPASAAAIELFKQGKPGDVLTPEEISEAIGELFIRPSATPRAYSHLQSAIEYVERNHLIVWEWERDSVVYRCLGDAEKTGTLPRYMLGIRRKAKRLITRSKTVDVSRLTDDQRRDHSLMQALGGMLATAAGGSFRKQLAARTNGGLSEPSTAKLLDLMNGKPPAAVEKSPNSSPASPAAPAATAENS